MVSNVSQLCLRFCLQSHQISTDRSVDLRAWPWTRRVVSCHGSAANLPPETHVGHVGIIGIMIQLVGLELTRRCLKRTSFDGITSEKYISLEYFWILLILYWWSAKINNFDQFWSCASFKIENPWNTAKNERGGCSTGKSATYPITYCVTKLCCALLKSSWCNTLQQAAMRIQRVVRFLDG